MPRIVASLNTRSKDSLPKVETLTAEMQERTTNELGICITENLNFVEKVTDKSKNLKGNFVRSPRRAVGKVEAASTVLALRTTASADEYLIHMETENERLRAQLF